eukprot:jgi/Tetstr1/428415/TSEL_018429.t1
MAKELRKSRREELFPVAVREVFDVVAELRTDQSTEWTEELKESLMEFADIIAEPTDLPPERELDFEINLESDEPPKERTYRMSPAVLHEVRSQLEELLAKGGPSKSNYAAPILFVRKKDGTVRQIKMDPRKVEAVQQWHVPKTVKDVRGFLGRAGYYRKFIHNFAAIAAPLHDLTKNQPEFVWTPRADAAFRALKDAMFRCCLDGAAGFTVITDHDTLRHFFRQRDLSTRQVRWLQVFAPYQRHMDIVYKRGTANHADALSRRPDLKDALQKLDLLNNWSEDEAD